MPSGKHFSVVKTFEVIPITSSVSLRKQEYEHQKKVTNMGRPYIEDRLAKQIVETLYMDGLIDFEEIDNGYECTMTAKINIVKING